PASGEVLNLHAINAARKIRAFKLFNEHEIPCPEWSLSYNEINKLISPKRTIFARRDGLSGGKGIVIISPEMRAEKKNPTGEFDFFSARISHDREFRIHVWNKN